MRKLKTIFLLILKVKNWPLFLFDYWYTGKRHSDQLFCYRFWSGTDVFVRAFTDDKWAISEVFLKDDYWHSNFNPLSDSPVIIDLGAHIGSFTLKAAEKYPTARIIALEPTDTFIVLQKNVSENHLSGVTALNLAVAARSGEMKFYIDPEHSVFNSFIARQDTKGGYVKTVKTISLEQLLTDYRIQRVDLLKCDVEGAEFEFLLTLSADTLSKIANITMEYHLFKPEYHAQDLIDWLTQRQFILLEHTPVNHEIGLLKFRNIAL